jgi:hypothetical protein
MPLSPRGEGVEELPVRSMSLIAGATLMAACAIATDTGSAAADANNPALNGRYLATSNGEWAMTNESFHDEVTVQSVWTITSSCSTPQDCAGTVTSDEGWTADITFRSGDKWRVDREIPNWEPCADGTAATGLQNYVFWPSETAGAPESAFPRLGKIDMNSPILTGWQQTTGPSGACGWNKTLDIRTPFKLVPIA